MTWLSLAAALLALVGVVITNIVTYKNNRAIDVRWRAELTALEGRADRSLEADERQDKRAKALDIYKWAADRAISDDPRIAQSGVDALKALLVGDLLDANMKPLVTAALRSSFAREIRAIERAAASEDEVQVVQVDLEGIERGEVSWSQSDEAPGQVLDEDGGGA